MRTLRPAERRRADEFARAVEGEAIRDSELAELAGLARAIRPAQTGIDPAFRSALRERLLAEPAPVAAPTHRRTDPARPHRARSWPKAAAALTAASLALGAGTAVAASHAVPGDVLYGVKRGVEAVQLALAGGDRDRADTLLDRADERLDEVETLLARPGSGDTAPRLRAALLRADDASEEAAALLLAAYDNEADAAVLAELDARLVRQQERLLALIPRLPEAVRGDARAVLLTLVRAGRAVLQRVEACGGCAPARSAGSLLPDDGLVAGVPLEPPGGAERGNDGPATAVPSAPTPGLPRVSVPPAPRGTVPGVPAPGVPTPSVPAPRPTPAPSVPVPPAPVPPAPVPSVPVPPAPVPSVPVPPAPVPSVRVPPAPVPSVPLRSVPVPSLGAPSVRVPVAPSPALPAPAAPTRPAT